MQHVKVYESFSEEKTYSFEELSPEAQAKAIEDHRDINVEDQDWHEGVIDECKVDLEDDGFQDVEIMYSGFWSQGDGASFTGWIPSDNMWRFVNEILGFKYPPVVLDCLTIQVERNQSRYYHENSVDVEVDYDSREDVIEDFPLGMEVPFTYRLPDIVEEVDKKAAEWVKSRCREIYNKLEEEYEAQVVDEAVKDTLLANDYEYDEEGNII